MKKENIARVLMAVTMFIFGTLAPFVRNINVSSGELALYRAVMAAALVGGVLLITKQKIPFASIKKELLLLLLSGAAMGINWILLFEAYKYTTVSVATLSYYFAPVIVLVVCPFLFKEKLTGKQIICFVMSTAGLVLITGTAGGGARDLLGVTFGISAAFLYAAVMLLNKFIKGVSGLHRTFIQFLAAIMVLFPYVLFSGGFSLSGLDRNGWGALLIVGFLHTGINYCMYFFALKELPGQKVAMLSYIDPLVAVLVSVIWLHEIMTVPQAVGGALILGFTLWSELPGRKKTDKVQEAIERIQRMEAYFDELQKLAGEDPGGICEDSSVREHLRLLIQYYENGQWLQDYELDEKGLLPQDLKRGVLSQDGVYDLLERLNVHSTQRR